MVYTPAASLSPKSGSTSNGKRYDTKLPEKVDKLTSDVNTVLQGNAFNRMTPEGDPVDIFEFTKGKRSRGTESILDKIAKLLGFAKEDSHTLIKKDEKETVITHPVDNMT